MAKLFNHNLNYMNLEWDFVGKQLQKLMVNNFIAEEPCFNNSRTIKHFQKPKINLVGIKQVKISQRRTNTVSFQWKLH